MMDHFKRNSSKTSFFKNIIGEKIGFNKEYENANLGLWMLDKDVDKWGIEVKFQKPRIEWTFQFENWGDFDLVTYVHVENLQPYKEDPEKVIVFLVVLKSTSQARVICNNLKMDDALHLKR